MASDRFNVIVRIEMTKVHPDTHAWTGERMTVSEDFEMGVAGWAQMAGILGQFVTLADSIRREQER